MKSPAFDYVRADSIGHVHALLAQHGDDARVLAGGQTLLATLNMRLSQPTLLVDIGGLSGLGGINVNVQLAFAVEEDFATAPLYGSKKIVLAPRIPVQRMVNNNPIVTTYTAQLASAAKQPFGDAVPLPLGRCLDLAAAGQVPFMATGGNRVRITPIEPPGAREPYVVPTLSGGSRMFTESLTYQWLATAGGFTAGSTGGKRDAFGNPALLYSDWKAPTELNAPLDVSLWILPRDERLGSAWVETCIRVMP